MGDCYFLKNFYQNRGDLTVKENPETYIIASESLGSIIENTTDFLPSNQIVNDKVRRDFARLINGTIGVWFYESDLWNKELLKKKLQEIIERIDDIKI